MTSKLNVRAEVGFDIDSTLARVVYWPGKNNISLEYNIKFYRRSTIVVRSPPPSHTSAIIPAAVVTVQPTAAFSSGGRYEPYDGEQNG